MLCTGFAAIRALWLLFVFNPALLKIGERRALRNAQTAPGGGFDVYTVKVR